MNVASICVILDLSFRSVQKFTTVKFLLQLHLSA